MDKTRVISIFSILLFISFSSVLAQSGFTQITDWDSIFGGNVTAEGFYEYDGTYVIPIFKVNWSQGVGDLEGYGLNATVKLSNLNYAINLYWQNITNFPTDISFFNNDVGYITLANVTIYQNLSQFINDVGYIIASDLTWNNITGKPTMISYWNNDVGYITMLNLSELYQLVQILNISIQNESQIRNQTDDMIISMLSIIYSDLQDEILARISGDANLTTSLNNLNISLTAEINNLYAGITSLNNTKSGIGNCPTGYAVQNLTTGTPQCTPIMVTETDPIFTAENSTIWNAIWDRLLITDQRYNDTALIYQIAGNLYTSIDQLNLSIQNLNQTLYQEINQVYSVISILNGTLYQEIYDRQMGDYYLNLSIQQEIYDRSYADNQTNLRIDALNNTKSGIGNCPEGFVVQNLTTGSPDCVAILNLETDPVFLANNQSIWDAIALKLNITDQRYNDTGLIYQINNTLMIEIGELTLDIQNINLSLQQEIIDRINADNSLNFTIIDLANNLSIETQARIQNDTYLLSRIPTVYGDGVYTYATTDGQNYTVNFNDTKLNQTIEIMTGIYEENVTFSVSGGVGFGQTTQCCSGSVEILEIAVFPTTITNNYKFYSNTSITGEVIDQDRATHVGNWIVAHAGLVVFDDQYNGHKYPSCPT